MIAVNNVIYFINQNSGNKLHANEYYPTSKGIFARKGVNVNNDYIFLPA